MWLCGDLNASPLSGTKKACKTEKELSFSVHSKPSGVDLKPSSMNVYPLKKWRVLPFVSPTVLSKSCVRWGSPPNVTRIYKGTL